MKLKTKEQWRGFTKPNQKKIYNKISKESNKVDQEKIKKQIAKLNMSGIEKQTQPQFLKISTMTKQIYEMDNFQNKFKLKN